MQKISFLHLLLFQIFEFHTSIIHSLEKRWLGRYVIFNNNNDNDNGLDLYSAVHHTQSGLHGIRYWFTAHIHRLVVVNYMCRPETDWWKCAKWRVGIEAPTLQLVDNLYTLSSQLSQRKTEYVFAIRLHNVATYFFAAVHCRCGLKEPQSASSELGKLSSLTL